ncbi:MAG: PQQ-binding-like beta-propeller repeat protein [Tetragenococcus halophilus]|nr:PQQ-binding-like beta-propeller repeat protein [Tetragenococcus halophilus]
MPTPVYYNNAIYAATGDRHLYKLDADTGEFLDKVDIGSTISMSSPNLSDDTLFVGGSGPLPYTFTAYDLLTDELKWQTPFEDVVSGLDDVPPAVFDNKVVTTALEEAESEGDPKLYDHMIYAMDTETGEVLWEERLGTGAGVANNKSGAPMIYEGKIYVGSPVTKTFYAYELKTGQKIWEFENQPIKAPPVAKDGIVYFSNVKGEVYALNAKTGDVIAKKELGGILAPAGPVIVNETLFIGSQDSNVYAVPLEEFMSE